MMDDELDPKLAAIVDAITDMLDDLSDDERLEILSELQYNHYCVGCGRISAGNCQCQNDE